MRVAVDRGLVASRTVSEHAWLSAAAALNA